MLATHGVKKTRVISTHALQEMGTVGQKIVTLIKKKIKMKVEIINQQEEAELFFKAVLKDFDDSNYMLVDVGGGSV